MKNFILLSIACFFFTSCEKERFLPEISTDFEGKFVLEVQDQGISFVYTLEHGDLTQLPILDTTFIYNSDYKWIRNGQFIYYLRGEDYIPYSPSFYSPRVIKPNGELVHDFYYDVGHVLANEISPEGYYLAITKSNYFSFSPYIYVYSLSQAFSASLLDSIYGSPSSIAWAHDGERILFGMIDYPTDVKVAVYEMSTRLLTILFEDSYSPLGIESLGWSEDGNLVSFIKDSVLYVGDTKGLGTYAVSPETKQVVDAAWSGTAHELVYVLRSRDNWKTEIVIYDPISGTHTSLLETEDFISGINQISYSKDGNSIAFIEDYKGLFIIGRDGTAYRQIYNGIVESFDWYED